MTAQSYIDPTALVHRDAVLEPGVSVWNWTKIRENVKVGRNTKIGQGVYIDIGVTIGRDCKIQNGVSLYHGLTIEDLVFIGPNATFTNDLLPRTFNAGWSIVPTRIQTGASIGANATIRCGVTIGRFAMVAAGAVVTQDVPEHALVIGCPARLTDYVTVRGRRLHHDLSSAPPSAAELHDAEPTELKGE